MGAMAQMIADFPVVEMIADAGRRFRAHIALLAKELPGRRSGQAAFLFIDGIGPEIQMGAAHCHKAGRRGGHKEMLIKGHFFGMIDILQIIFQRTRYI